MAKIPVYFSGSISGGRSDGAYYKRLIDALVAAGHRVHADHVGSATLTGSGEPGPPAEIFERDVKWIRDVSQAGGALVAEVSSPSIGVGYEIAAARYLFSMPVICLFRPAYVARCSAMVAGDSAITLLESKIDDAEESVVRRLLDALAALGE